MARNGSGVFSPSATGYPAVAGTTIESAKYNAVMADIATALTGSIACNGESTITGNIPMATYKITGLGNATADADALNRVTADARYAALTSPTFTGSVIVSTAQPIYWLVETDGASNEKRWAIQGNAGGFYVSAFNDAADTATNAISVSRNGITINTIALAATTIAVTGALTVNSIDVTPTQGSFTMSLRETTSGGTVIATGTAYWQKIGKCVTLRIPALSATSTATAFYITGIPAGAQVGTLGETGPQYIVGTVINGAVNYPGLVGVTEGVGEFPLYSSVSAWAGGASGKGVGHHCITYQVAD